jgi:hemerythrin-like domain-containing protein
MNQKLDHDHAELDGLLHAALAALADGALDRAFAPLDTFWARLAVHIRAENLHLFPALLGAAEESPQHMDAPPPGTVAEVIKRLRADHDYFMSELAAAMKALRTMRRQDRPPVSPAELAGLRDLLDRISRRLADHNAVEETQAYRWVESLLDSAQQTNLATNIQR